MEKLQANSGILIIGGSETTATLLSGVTFFLLTNPEALKKLTAEIRSAFRSEDEINFVSVSALPYLLACLDEALRMYPPVPNGLPRTVPKGGATVAGHYVPEDVSPELFPLRNFSYPLDLGFANPARAMRENRTSSPSTSGPCTTTRRTS